MEIIRTRFTLEAVEKILLPEYKGSSFHGGFGHALKQISPSWYSYFFEQQSTNGQSLPNPYVLLPPLDKKQEYAPGDRFDLHLTLFGEAAQHSSICHAAIEFLGNQLGLGYQKGKYRIISTETQKFQPALPPSVLESISLQAPTRIRLKHRNRLCRKPPDFAILITRLIDRTENLYDRYGQRPPDLPSRESLIEQARSVQIQQHHFKWDDWDRFSGSQRKWMKFGGLQGHITYQGELAPFYQLLRLGEWLHVGGKTSFGLGKYELQMEVKTA